MRNTTHTIRSRRAQGFSALELMAVLILVAIFAALALPSFDGTLKRYRVDAAASSVASALQFARSEAIRTGTAVSVAGGSCAPGLSRNCSVNVLDTQGTKLKTISEDSFKGLNIEFPRTDIIYSPLGIFQGSNTENAISLWPVGSDSAQDSPYASKVCPGASGRVRVVASSAAC